MCLAIVCRCWQCSQQVAGIGYFFAATGATFLNAIQETHGKFNVKEVFAETTIPLLADLPYVQDLSLNAAVRYADYSTIGDATSWKTGFAESGLWIGAPV